MENVSEKSRQAEREQRGATGGGAGRKERKKSGLTGSGSMSEAKKGKLIS